MHDSSLHKDTMKDPERFYVPGQFADNVSTWEEGEVEGVCASGPDEGDVIDASEGGFESGSEESCSDCESDAECEDEDSGPNDASSAEGEQRAGSTDPEWEAVIERLHAVGEGGQQQEDLEGMLMRLDTMASGEQVPLQTEGIKDSEEPLPSYEGADVNEQVEELHEHAHGEVRAVSRSSMLGSLDDDDDDDELVPEKEVDSRCTGLEEYLAKCGEMRCAPISRFASEPTTRVLDITHRGISNRGAFALSEMVKANEILQELYVADNNIDAIGLTSLLLAITQSPQSLVLLDAGQNPVGAVATKTKSYVDWHALISGAPCLESLFLRKCKLRGADVDSIAEGISSTRTMAHLDLGDNGLTESAIVVLCDTASQIPCLNTLSLSWNSLGSRAGATIGNILSSDHSFLAHLDVSWNRLGDAGIESLASGLAKTKTLKRLDVSHNGFSQSGCIAIEQALRQGALEVLEDLELDGNSGCGNAGAVAIVSALPADGKCSLQRIRMDGCGVGFHGPVPVALLSPEPDCPNVPDLIVQCAGVLKSTSTSSVKVQVLAATRQNKQDWRRTAAPDPPAPSKKKPAASKTTRKTTAGASKPKSSSKTVKK